jgi:hypothetical protein
MKSLRQQFSGILSRDDHLDRSCQDIPPESCRQAPCNLHANTANGAASKLAEQIAGPNLVLPWLFHIIGAPVWLFGFLMPIKQTFSLLPQMVVAGQIRRLAVRKWVWVVCGLVQALCLLLMIPVALWLPPAGAGVVLLLLLIVFSSASGAASVAFQDVLGKTVDKGRRGNLLARRAFYGGILTVIAGLLLNRYRNGQDDLSAVLFLLLAAAVLWGVAALFFALIREFPGAVAGGRNAIDEVRAGFDLLRREPGFARFLRARGLLLSIELATPFYVLHAGQSLSLSATQIGTLVIAIGVAQIVSSPFWGKMADRTSRNVMALSAIIGAFSAFLALALVLVPAGVRPAGYALVFVLIGLSEAGVRLGRKTYLVDATPHTERATYTAFSNSLIGVVALLSGITGLIAHQFGAAIMLVVILLFMLAAYWACRQMPEAEQMRRAA